MKFDFVIGNPPFHDETLGDNNTYAPQIYYKFLDAAYEISDKVEMIHPGRFLFNAGSTPKAWNKKMLKDEHFKVMHYEAFSGDIFPNTDIKGGVAISYRDKDRNYGAIDIFTPYQELNSILTRVKKHPAFSSLKDIVVTSYAYHFTKQLYEDFPELKGSLSEGHEYDLKSNVFKKMPDIFFDEMPEDGNSYISIIGRIENKRIFKYVKEIYIKNVINLHSYKVILPGAMGAGKFGEAITTSFIGNPGVGSTETFLSIGCFDNYKEAENVEKYIKTKFARTLLGVKKRTQANTPEKWEYVPLQDFTTFSDIDWSQSIETIDKQLYKKYNLSDEEIDFIETKVKGME